MRILIYSHAFAPSVGGVETIVQSLAEGLDDVRGGDSRAEFKVTVVTQTASDGLDGSVFPFPVVRRANVAKLWSLVRESDIIHIAGPSLLPLFLAFLARKPFVVEHHGYQAICPNGLLSYQPGRTICPGHFQERRYRKCWRCQNCELSPYQALLNLLLMFPRSWLVRRAAKNLTITRYVLERHRLPRAEVVYYGIEDPLPKGNLCPATNPPERVLFAFAGRLVAEKGIPVLLEAARQLISEQEIFDVRLVGDGPERARLEDIIRRDKLESHVRITGYLTGAALVEALRDVRVVVMPSVWEETAGLAAIEQMMRGRLVIASNIGGLSEVVGSTGLRFAPGDATALAECMRRVLHHPALVDEVGREARARALSLFARPRMIDEHRHVYRRALDHAATWAKQNLPQTGGH
jgi:glycosyltransferase involved in cell wall biosynthesis